MITSTAWKNVWRNKVRSLVVIISVTIGIFGGVFAVAVMNGAIEQRVDAALSTELAHIQISRPEFRENYDIHLTLGTDGELENALSGEDEIAASAKRTLLSAMATTASKSTGVQVIGIDPEQDRKIFSLDQKLIPGTGSYFNSGSRGNEAYIGEQLAKDLNIIRYILTEQSLDTLRSEEIPETVLEKLQPFLGERFKNEDAFIESMQEVLTKKESSKYGRSITESAWSFRKRTRLTFTFLDKQGIQTGGIFRITGLYDIKNSMFESRNVFVKNSDLQSIAGLNNDEYHMEVIRIEDIDQTKTITTALRDQLQDYEVRSWKEISPELAMMNDLVEKFYFVFMIIILAALAFGIVNTMLMVVLERTKELGMLTAIGMNKKRVFRMIMTESVFLSLIGGIVGMIVSWLLIAFTSSQGINFVKYGEGFEAMGFSSHIYPEISLSFFIIVTVLIIITGVLSSIYPALKALKLDPADALRTE